MPLLVLLTHTSSAIPFQVITIIALTCTIVYTEMGTSGICKETREEHEGEEEEITMYFM